MSGGVEADGDEEEDGDDDGVEFKIHEDGDVELGGLETRWP